MSGLTDAEKAELRRTWDFGPFGTEEHQFAAVEAIVRRRVAEAIRDAADELREQAALRMDEHGPHDARGVAIWDCASWVRLYAEARRITH